jgi:hypothetical protein
MMLKKKSIWKCVSYVFYDYNSTFYCKYLWYTLVSIKIPERKSFKYRAHYVSGQISHYKLVPVSIGVAQFCLVLKPVSMFAVVGLTAGTCLKYWMEWYKGSGLLVWKIATRPQ